MGGRAKGEILVWPLEQMKNSPLSTKEESKAPLGDRAVRKSVLSFPDPLRGPVGSPGWHGDQRMWRLLFNFHLLQISLPGISGLKD